VRPSQGEGETRGRASIDIGFREEKERGQKSQSRPLRDQKGWGEGEKGEERTDKVKKGNGNLSGMENVVYLFQKGDPRNERRGGKIKKGGKPSLIIETKEGRGRTQSRGKKKG